MITRNSVANSESFGRYERLVVGVTTKTPLDHPFVYELNELIKERRVQMIGPIRQEILSGLKEETQFKALQKHLNAFPDLELITTDYERAAAFFNTNRRKGIQGSNTDFLICACRRTI